MSRFAVGATCSLLVLSFAATAAGTVEGTPESNKVRTFHAQLGTTGAPHAVHFDARSNELAICANGEASLCQQWKVKADDVLPITINGVSKLLVVDTPFSYRTCTVAAQNGHPDLSCAPIDLWTLLGEPARATGTAVIRLNMGTQDEFMCGYSMKRGVLCSSAQRLQARKGSVLFGRFTGDKKLLQALSVDGKRVCNIGGTCRIAEGLELVSTADALTASSRVSKNLDRSSITGITEFGHTACVAFFESQTRVGFTCEQEIVPSTGPVAEIFTTHGSGPEAREIMTYGAKTGLPSRAQRLSSTDDEVAAQRERTVRGRELLLRAFKNAGGVMTPKNFKAALEDDQDFRSGLLQVTLRSPWKEDDGDWGYGPVYFQMALNGGSRSPGLWSDAYGYEFWMFLTGQALADCLAACDLNKNAGDSWCDVGASTVFTLLEIPVVIATVSVWWTGPGAGAVFLNGTAVAGGVGGGALLLCRGFTGNNRIACAAECHRRP